METRPRWKMSEAERLEFVDPLRANIWNVVIPAVASLVGGALAGAGGREAADAEADAARDATNLQRDVYLDQRGLARPGYITGGAATNLLAAQYGVGPQNYELAYGGSGGTNGLTNPNGQSDQWSSYLSANPDVYDYWKGNDKLRQMYPNANDFAAYHYANFGQAEGRQLPTGNTQSPNIVNRGDGTYGVGADGQSLQPATNGLSNPMAGFMSSPYGQIAVEGFRGVDVPEISAAYARGGKVLSGAQSAALDDRGKARLGGAYNDYTNGLRSLAGLNQTASSQISGAAGQYGANAGNLTLRAGEAQGRALQSGYNGLTQGISGAVSGIMDYGKKNWGWA